MIEEILDEYRYMPTDFKKRYLNIKYGKESFEETVKNYLMFRRIKNEFK